MRVSRREFIKKTCMATTSTLLPALPLSVFSRTAWADPPARIEPKTKYKIECVYAYIHKDGVYLLVDIIRNYQRMLFRGFMVADGHWYDFSRVEKLFPFNPERHLYCEDNGEIAQILLNSNYIYGKDLHIRETDNPGARKVSFEATYEIMAEPFSSSNFFDLGSDTPFKKLVDAFTVEAISLLHEDFPYQKITGNVKLIDHNGNPLEQFSLDNAKCAIAHHWGWAFPNYVLLMCNDFGNTDTVLTLCCNEVLSRAAIDIKVGYLYMKPDPDFNVVCPMEGKVLPFVEDNKLSIIAYKEKEEGVRVDIDYKHAVRAFPNFFNTYCTTYLGVPCEVIDMSTGQRRKGKGAVMDIKGLELP